MLNGMSHSGHVVFIAEASDIDIHSSTGLVGFGVVDYQGLKLVREADDPIGPVIQRGGLKAVRDDLDLPVDRGVRRELRNGVRGSHDKRSVVDVWIAQAVDRWCCIGNRKLERTAAGEKGQVDE